MPDQFNIHTNNNNLHVTSPKTQNININLSSSTDSLSLTMDNLNMLQVALQNTDEQIISLMEYDAIPSSGDYNTLVNKPSLNGVTIRGNMTLSDLHLLKQSINTKEHWDSHLTYIPDYGEIVIYTNRTVDGISYPGIKIGDGNSYLIDLPFVGDDLFNQITDLFMNHINNHDIHVTQEEKNFWNNKLNCEFENETLVITRS